MTLLEKAWEQNAGWLVLLAPLEALYRFAVRRRREAFRRGQREVWQAPVPVVIVGNLSVGGTGKSPLVARLARDLMANGYKPGIVSRGYGGKASAYPLRVSADTPVTHSGDEPLMLAQQTGVPVAVDPNRAQAARLLIEQGCNVLLADDGLQHYALGRTLELAVVDGAHGFGNRHCLPRGPLREPVSRLANTDAVIGNGGFARLEADDGRGVPRFEMRVTPSRWRHLSSQETYPIDERPFATRDGVVAMAGIGRPQRFFDTLDALDVTYQPLALGDHHDYQPADLPTDARIIVMTAKDAVKCAAFADTRCWVLDVEAELSADFDTWWSEQVRGWQLTGKALPETP